ncbi:3-hydroxybutyryl-CoA dehydrogenase-like [Panonychus citri]|uniref:3-hydroxybutyryl-CoA dehydrogenase-like n=1 Tax=Panonychus citri TaxID=50023 RepID=UPI002307956A|nr:3-hydroxybutyryl-CoA dehydrogenase-like [Panonychus citri]
MVRIAVIGCGVLGIKIIGALAYYGHEIRAYDNDANVLNKVYLRLSEDRRMLREEGFMIGNEFVGEVFCFSSLEDTVRGAQFVFESVSEDIQIKKSIFKKIGTICPEDTVLSTGTMRLSVNEIFEDIKNRERCIGIRFLYPVYPIPEVELITTNYTSVATLEKVRKFLEQMGRIAFFRSGPEPIILSEEQRESRKNAFIRQMAEKKGIGRRLTLPVPDLQTGSIDVDSLKETTNEAMNARKEKECVVCMDTDRDCVLHPCHHLCTCVNCGKLLLKRQDACPICRRPITNVFRVFHP